MPDEASSAGSEHPLGSAEVAPVRSRHGLGVRILVWVAGLNVVIFAAAGAYLYRVVKLQAEQGVVTELTETLRSSISPQGANVANILTWPGWPRFEDAYLIDDNLVRRVDGSLRPRGVALHPLGANRRDSMVSLDAVVVAMDQAMERRRPVAVAEGNAIPIEIDGAVWGACWLKLPSTGNAGGTLRLLLPWFAISTLVLTLGGFFAVRHLVLEPVSQIASGAHRMSAGQLDVVVPGTGRGDELDELVDAFNAMARRVEGFNRELAERVSEATVQARRAEQAAMIQRRLAAMGELAAGIAHEINNPLGGLQNAVEALRKPDLPAERRERYVALLASGLERIRGTVGQVLRMAPRDVRSAPVDMRDVVEDALALVRHRAESEGVELRVEAPPAHPATVHGSRNELGQALLNLLVNALDSLQACGREKGWVAVSIQMTPQWGYELVVEDNGPGVSPETLARATDLFFSTKDPGKGTGLGLAIVHNVADTHGGSLELESVEGEFFRARLRLPAGAEGAAS